MSVSGRTASAAYVNERILNGMTGRIRCHEKLIIIKSDNHKEIV